MKKLKLEHENYVDGDIVVVVHDINYTVTKAGFMGAVRSKPHEDTEEVDGADNRVLLIPMFPTVSKTLGSIISISKGLGVMTNTIKRASIDEAIESVNSTSLYRGIARDGGQDALIGTILEPTPEVIKDCITSILKQADQSQKRILLRNRVTEILSDLRFEVLDALPCGEITINENRTLNHTPSELLIKASFSAPEIGIGTFNAFDNKSKKWIDASDMLHKKFDALPSTILRICSNCVRVSNNQSPIQQTIKHELFT